MTQCVYISKCASAAAKKIKGMDEQLFSLMACGPTCRRVNLASALERGQISTAETLAGNFSCPTVADAEVALDELVQVGIAVETDGGYRIAEV